MVKIMEHPLEMDDFLGENPLFLETSKAMCTNFHVFWSTFPVAFSGGWSIHSHRPYALDMGGSVGGSNLYTKTRKWLATMYLGIYIYIICI